MTIKVRVKTGHLVHPGLPWARRFGSAAARGLVTLGLVVPGLVALSSACGGREGLGVSALSVVSAGVINDPANKTLRFDLLEYGMERFCTEMKRRGAPIKLSDYEPVLGRFFADTCHTQIIDHPDRQSVVLSYSGKGYCWTNVTGRLGFASAGVLEYAVDFQRHGDSMYIYFRPRSVGGASFKTLLIESALAQVGLGLSGIDAEAMGKDVITRQLERGFTVIRYSERGEVELGPGLIPPGQRPFKPYQIKHSEKLTLDNDRTELHPGQQDFIGGVTVAGSDQRLTLTLSLDGAPAVDVFVVPDLDGQMLTQAYVTQAGGARLSRAPLLDAELRSGPPLKLEVNAPPGNYYLVLDHSTSMGRSSPAVGERAAKVDYLVQVGER